MKLYTHKLSPYSAKVRIALEEKGLAFEEVALPIRRSGIVEKPAELLAINPRGQVPTLVHGDVKLHDSTVILEYLEDLKPRPPLYPRGAAERARARLLEDNGDWMLGTCVEDLLRETFRKPEESTRDAALIAGAAGAIRRMYGRLERELDGREHFCGEFGVADIGCYLPVSFAAFFGVPPEDAHPRLRAWLSRVGARPSVAREVASMTEALKKLED
jgi:glutathione S-transferase